MKIAQIASPWIAIPPKNYGGTENVLYTLVEEQVAQGYKVTLFAPGDAKTSAKLVSFLPKSLLAAGESWQAHLKAYYHFHCTVEYLKEHDFDVVHTHLSSAADLYLYPLMASLATPYIATLHSPFPFDTAPKSQLGRADEYYMAWLAAVRCPRLLYRRRGPITSARPRPRQAISWASIITGTRLTRGRGWT